jgi:hypothetical protein
VSIQVVKCRNAGRNNFNEGKTIVIKDILEITCRKKKEFPKIDVAMDWQDKT